MGRRPCRAPGQFAGYGAPQPVQDDWLRGSNPNQKSFPRPAESRSSRRRPPRRFRSRSPLNARDSGPINAANPMLAAATPLLILLGRLRLMIIDPRGPAADAACGQQDHRVRAQRARCRHGSGRSGDRQICAVRHRRRHRAETCPGTDTHVWLQYSMLAQFFQRRTSGVGFYEELAKLMQHPGAHYDLLELMHACLSLGFEGQYRGTADGVNQLAAHSPRRLPDAAPGPRPCRRRYFPTLARSRFEDARRGRARADLGGGGGGRGRSCSASISCCGCCWGARRRRHRRPARCAVAGQPDHAAAPVGLRAGQDRRHARSHPARAHPYRELKPDILKGCVNVDTVGDDIVVQVCNVLFDSGSATVQPRNSSTWRSASARRSPRSRAACTSSATTDNVKPIGPGQVQVQLRPVGGPRQGRGGGAAAEHHRPLAPDDRGSRRARSGGRQTPPRQARAQNRRVEIMLPAAGDAEAGRRSEHRWRRRRQTARRRRRPRVMRAQGTATN